MSSSDKQQRVAMVYLMRVTVEYLHKRGALPHGMLLEPVYVGFLPPGREVKDIVDDVDHLAWMTLRDALWAPEDRVNIIYLSLAQRNMLREHARQHPECKVRYNWPELPEDSHF